MNQARRAVCSWKGNYLGNIVCRDRVLGGQTVKWNQNRMLCYAQC